MKEKGIDQYIEAAKYFKSHSSNTNFHVCGFIEDEKYHEIIKQLARENIIIYHGMVTNISEILVFTHCIVLPSYYPEGINNVLLESAASGRPIITTNRSGCGEIINDGINGFLVKEKDSQHLISAISRFLDLSFKEREEMGVAGRIKVEKEYDRNIVVNAYLREIQ